MTPKHFAEYQPPPGRSAHRASAFSLVEIVLALSILSFGLVALLGLFPVGLGAFRNSKEKVTHGEIIKLLASELSSMRFDQLASVRGKPYYFAEDGSPVIDTNESFVYRVEIDVVQPNTPLPTGTTSPASLSDCSTVQIRIAHARPENATPWRYNLIIANRGL